MMTDITNHSEDDRNADSPPPHDGLMPDFLMDILDIVLSNTQSGVIVSDGMMNIVYSAGNNNCIIEKNPSINTLTGLSIKEAFGFLASGILENILSVIKESHKRKQPRFFETPPVFKEKHLDFKVVPVNGHILLHHKGPDDDSGLGRYGKKRSDDKKSILSEESGKECFIAVDEKGTVKTVNNRFCEMTGFQRENIVGCNAEEFLKRQNSFHLLNRNIVEKKALGGNDDGEICYLLTPMEFHKSLSKPGGTFNAYFDFAEYPEDTSQYSGIRSKLEALVDQRAAELAKMNALLKSEIDERRATEKKLNVEQVRYKVLFDAIMDAVFVHKATYGGLSNRFIEVNDVACKRLKYTREELINLSPRDVDDEKSAPDYDLFIDQLKEKGHFMFEMVHLAKDGEKIPVEIHSRMFDLNGEPTVLSIARDIKERKAAEIALKESEALLNETQKIARIGGWEYNLQLNKLFWTKEVYRIHEVSDDYVPVVDKAIQFYAPIHRSVIKKAFEESIERGMPFDLELELITARGNHRWVRSKGEPKFIDGKVNKVSGTFQDITQKIHVQEALKVTETKYRILIEQLPAVVYIANLDYTGSTAYISPQSKLYLGYDSNDFEKNPAMFEKIVHPDDRQRVMDILHQVMEKKTSLNVEYRIVKPNGDIVWVWDLGDVLYDLKGRPVAIQGVMFDVTERKRNESELVIAKQKAEEASRAKTKFLANTSHELRTPLNAVIGFSEILLDEIFGPLNDKQKSYVDNILQSGSHLLNLINDILDLSKAESGKMLLNKTAVKLSDLLEKSMLMIHEKAIKRKINLVLEIQKEIKDFRFSADSIKMKQIVFNLLSNAVKHTPHNGEIMVTAEKNENILRFRVKDTGVGLSGDELESIFNEFEQARYGGSREKNHYDEKGTGLGLALSRKLVELHGGRIWAESDGRGKGAVFIFEIPV